MAQITISLGEELQEQTISEERLLSDVLAGTPGFSMPCAGHGRCGKCRVRVRGALSPVTAEERAALSAEERSEGVRLACCTRILGDAAVTLLPPESFTQICGENGRTLLPRQPLFHTYGVAVDIGTTTLAAQLYDKSGLRYTETAVNPQSGYGADVISRIGLALEGKGNALAFCVQKGVNALLVRLSERAHILPSQIDALVVTGNTAMLYLLTGRNPDCLSHAPFCADTLFGGDSSAETLHLSCAANARVYLPPCISSFVGADMTTALLASGICAQSETALLTDIGTNGEMALWHKGQLLCCATAAGPAFEGAGLSKGMQGRTGAIDEVSYRGELPFTVHTIGGATPCGICGSGIVSALAAMKQASLLDETGYLSDGANEVFLTKAVSVTQKDVRMVQLAKSAICAGLETLMELAQISCDEVTQLAIAGGFGSYLNLRAAAQIGLFPAALEEKAQVLGNAALTGGAMLLLDRGAWESATELAAAAKTVDLGTNPTFMDRYVEDMCF